MASDGLINIGDSPQHQDGTGNVPSLWHRPGQWTVFGYRFVPLVLFAVGTCGAIYGAFYRGIPVVETKVEKYTVEVPDKQAPPPMPPEIPGFGPPGFGADDPFLPPLPPKMKEEERTRTKTIETLESELAVNRAVTVDGLERVPGGWLAWTGPRDGGGQDGGGSGGSKGPAACPT